MTEGSRRLCACDIGSNTVHALVGEVHGGKVTEVARFVEMPSLGAEVDRTGRIGTAKGEEAVSALELVVGQARQVGFEHLMVGATEAVRQAADGAEFLARCSDAIDHPVRLVSTQREAELSFAGVAAHHAGRRQWLMGDLGGGSMELVVAHGRRIQAWRSLRIGSGVLAAKHLSDPPKPGEREALRAEAVELLRGAPECDPAKIVVTGGTASNLPKVVSMKRPPLILTRQSLLTTAERLDSAPAAELMPRYLLRAGRVEAMRAGVEVLLLLLDWAGLDRLHVSVEGVRQGMMLAFLERGHDWWKDTVPS